MLFFNKFFKIPSSIQRIVYKTDIQNSVYKTDIQNSVYKTDIPKTVCKTDIWFECKCVTGARCNNYLNVN